MKDLPHHMKKLNRRVIRSMHREEMDEESFALPDIPPRKPSQSALKKKMKQAIKAQRKARVSSHPTPEERNKKMKKRVPVFDRTNNAKPKHAKASRKKTPRK